MAEMLDHGFIEKRREFIINFFYVAIIVALLALCLKFTFLWLMPFVIGFLCAIALQRPVAWLHKKSKIPRGIWSVVLVVVILSAGFSLLILAGYYGYRELKGLVDWLSGLVPSLSDLFSSVSEKFSGWLITLPDGLSSTMETMPGELMSAGLGMASDALTSTAKSIIAGTPGIIIAFIITIIACCFITSGYNQITAFILRQLSPKHKEIVMKSKRLFTENILKMLRGYLIIMCITFGELAIGLSIIRVDYAIAIALVIAVFDILPVLGTGGIMIPWVIIECIAGNWIRALSLFIVYAIITVIRNIIEPKIIGRQVGIPAIVTLLSMYLGLQIFGVLGMFAFPILIIIVMKLQENDLIHIWK